MIKKILHTSDLHTGRRLKNKERYDEFRKFFAWLENIIKSENIEALLISGDIFDNTTPSVQAQDIYYSFLGKITKTSCRHIVIISGNHDSPSFIDAPSELLKQCGVHVVGQACENPEDEVIILNDSDGKPEMIVCAVPYLRDRDVRTINFSDDNNSIQNIESALKSGIKNHYEKVFSHAEILQEKLNVPVVAMGHLFARGGKIQKDDGTRSLYVGTAVEIEVDDKIFPDFLTYTALGHLHSPQKIMRENIRYSGSPVAMTFGEAGHQKSVYIIELEGKNLNNIKSVPVPVFQRLERIRGDMEKIYCELESLAKENESVWLEITYTGSEVQGDLQNKLREFTKKFNSIEILSIYDESKSVILTGKDDFIPEGLENITPIEMLEHVFDKHKTPKEQRENLTNMYKEILREMGIDF